MAPPRLSQSLPLLLLVCAAAATSTAASFLPEGAVRSTLGGSRRGEKHGVWRLNNKRAVATLAALEANIGDPPSCTVDAFWYPISLLTHVVRFNALHHFNFGDTLFPGKAAGLEQLREHPSTGEAPTALPPVRFSMYRPYHAGVVLDCREDREHGLVLIAELFDTGMVVRSSLQPSLAAPSGKGRAELLSDVAATNKFSPGQVFSAGADHRLDAAASARALDALLQRTRRWQSRPYGVASWNCQDFAGDLYKTLTGTNLDAALTSRWPRWRRHSSLAQWLEGAMAPPPSPSLSLPSRRGDFARSLAHLASAQAPVGALFKAGGGLGLFH